MLRDGWATDPWKRARASAAPKSAYSSRAPRSRLEVCTASAQESARARTQTFAPKRSRAGSGGVERLAPQLRGTLRLAGAQAELPQLDECLDEHRVLAARAAERHALSICPNDRCDNFDFEGSARRAARSGHLVPYLAALLK
eukprot:scaffold12828_cov112-Isochrysis_galbana.AAC.6